MTTHALLIGLFLLGPRGLLVHEGTLSDSLRSPARIAVAPDGTVLVTDTHYDHIARYDASGIFLGTWPVPEGPVGVAAHPDGRYFVSLRDSGAVGIYDAGFNFLGLLGDGNPMVSFVAPTDIDIATDTGNIYVVDGEGDRLYGFDPAGNIVLIVGIRGGGSGEFRYPSTITVDEPRGRLIVADHDNFRLQAFTTGGIFELQFGYRLKFVPGQPSAGWMPRTQGVVVDADGFVYVADALMSTVRVFSAGGAELAKVLDFGVAVGDLRTPCDLALSNDGTHLYVVSTNTSSVEVYAAPTWGGTPLPELNRRNRKPVGTNWSEYDLLFEPLGELPSSTIDGTFDRSGGGGMSPLRAYTGPHMVDGPVVCGRCHGINDLPGGHEGLYEGQTLLCTSCHAAGGQALDEPIHEADAAVAHPWNVPAVNPAVGSLGPVPGGALALYLDNGNIKCTTCHDQHTDFYGSYLRMDNTTAGICKNCHRGEGAPIDHAVGLEHGPEYCTACHDPHASGATASLLKDSMFSWYNGGFVTVGFTDGTIGIGDGGFVDPDAGEYGLCDVCHAYFDDSVNPPVVSAEFLALTPSHTDSMPACTECHQHHNGFEPGIGAFGPDEYVSEGTCALCHTETHGQWTATIHRDAFDKLPPFAQNPAMGCVACHTVGFGDPAGFVDFATTPELAGVQCENCHGYGGGHASDPYGVTPVIDEAAEACGVCHTDSHHPTYDEWATSGHEAAANNSHSGSCTGCHAPLEPGAAHPELGVECVACHDPHAQTGNDAIPDAGGEYDNQLRFAEIMDPIPPPDNTIDGVQDGTRFGLCGQCHHSRGRSWDSDSRGPHHSLQVNTFLGEMPVPDGELPLVPAFLSDHAGLELQCNTCHMHNTPHIDADPNDPNQPEIPANTGHSWAVNYEACAACHDSAELGEALATAIQNSTHARLDGIMAALGDPSVWEYSCCGGPPSAADCAADPNCTFSQDDMTDAAKQARFLIKYVEGDSSFGVHNGGYTDAILDTAEALLGITPAPIYSGADTCGACHTGKHADWSGTLHEGAWETLNDAFNGTNPVCLPCHTVGFGEMSGYIDQATTPQLAGVQCENCHGAASDHVFDPHGVQPAIDASAEVCGACHTGSHHPTYDEWSGTGHEFAFNNSHSSSCTGCHAPLEPGSSHPTLGVECAACHDSHAQTGNALAPEPGRDYQLLYPEVVISAPSNFVDDATDPDRFGICGQCHHSRGRTWDSSSRGPHHSLQGNVLLGEMPMPAGSEGTPLVPNATGTHYTADLQCVTCHMYTAPHDDGPPEVVAVTGHTWEVNFETCNTAPGCHSTPSTAEAALTALQSFVDGELVALQARLGDPLLWQYSCCGGPPEGSPGQVEVPEEVAKTRFMVSYLEGDGSLGAHNSGYVISILLEANTLLDDYAAGGGIWPPPGGAWWGACCVGGACTEQMTEADCTTAGGVWFQGQACDEVVCP